MGHLAIINRKDGKVQSLRTVQAVSRIGFFFFFKGLSLKYVNWGKNTTVRSMQNKIFFWVVLFSVQLCSCFSHLLISVFYNLDGNYSSPTGCYEHLGTEKTGRNPGSHCPLLKKYEKTTAKKQPTHNKQQKNPQINQQPAILSNAFGTVMCHSTDLPGKITS